jgi:hypothetical protein
MKMSVKCRTGAIIFPAIRLMRESIRPPASGVTETRRMQKHASPVTGSKTTEHEGLD